MPVAVSSAQMNHVRCEVAMANIAMTESVTIVGDWFAARSISGTMGDGYRQTIFTRHAPTIATMIEEFDRRFNQYLYGSPVSKSQKRAIAEIERRISEIGVSPARTASKRMR